MRLFSHCERFPSVATVQYRDKPFAFTPKRALSLELQTDVHLVPGTGYQVPGMLVFSAHYCFYNIFSRLVESISVTILIRSCSI